MDEQALLKLAEKAKQNAYAPYSGFPVGAALLTDSGRVFSGCNVENAAFGVANCAERTALFSAVSEGYRNFTAIAITSDSDNYTAPCGVCRQALVEFNPEMKVIMGDNKGEYITRTLADLLPLYFNKENLTEKSGGTK